MAEKYLKQGLTAIEEVEAKASSAGAGDAGKIVALDGTGKLDTTLMPSGVGADTLSVVASEALSAGNLVNIFDDAGTTKARKADATGGVAKKADGYVLAAVTSGASATVYFDGTITGLTGLTAGSNYYLSTTAGGTTTTIPTAATNIAQLIGKALSTTSISFEPGGTIIRA
jgi:hypothetical protein